MIRSISLAIFFVFLTTILDSSHILSKADVGVSRSGGIVANVKRYGALGDDSKDDTVGIQKAIDAVYAHGGGVVFFPEGTYLVTSVNIREGMTFQGDKAVIKRPPHQPKDTKTFNTGKLPYGSQHDSRLIIIKDLVFDGNSQNQGLYKNYEQEHSHLLFFMADYSFAGRLKVIVDNCTFKNGVADAISIWRNVDIIVRDCKVENVFRGAVVLTGAYSVVRVSNLITKGDIDPTGIVVEIDALGYGNSGRVEVYLEKIRLDGRFEFSVKRGSESLLIGNDIVAEAPFFLEAKKSQVTLSNSHFAVAPEDRIMFPYNVIFNNCRFYAVRTKKPLKVYDRYHAAPLIMWSTSYFVGKNQRLTFKDCKFTTSENFQKDASILGIPTTFDLKEYNNILNIIGGKIGGDIDVGLIMLDRGGIWNIKGTSIDSELAISWDGAKTAWGQSQYADITIDGIKVTGKKYMEIRSNDPINNLKQTHIVLNESSNFIISSYGLDKNNYSGYRVINGSTPPTEETHGFLGDIYRIDGNDTKWVCKKSGYFQKNINKNVPAVWEKAY